MLIQFYTPMAYCIKRQSLSPNASGGEQTISAGTCLRAAQADKKFPLLCQYRVKAINVSSHAVYAVPPSFFLLFSSRFSFDVFCAFFFTSLLAPWLWAIHYPFLNISYSILNHNSEILNTKPPSFNNHFADTSKMVACSLSWTVLSRQYSSFNCLNKGAKFRGFCTWILPILLLLYMELVTIVTKILLSNTITLGRIYG